MHAADVDNNRLMNVSDAERLKPVADASKVDLEEPLEFTSVVHGEFFVKGGDGRLLSKISGHKSEPNSSVMRTFSCDPLCRVESLRRAKLDVS